MGIFFIFDQGAFWGLLVHANIYFNAPDPRLNWWAEYVLAFRWNRLISAVLLISLVIHWRKRARHKLHPVK